MIKKILFVLFLLALPTMSTALMISYDNSLAFNTTGVTNYKTYGDMMDGMTVTAWYSDGTSESALWADTVSGSGAATGSYFSLSQSRDTFNSLWNLSTTAGFLTSITIDAGTGNSVFDVIGGTKNSPGSSLGLPFKIDSASVAVDVTYSGAVSVADSFYGDLYRYLEIDFINGFGADDYLSFLADTDNLILPDDLTLADLDLSLSDPEQGVSLTPAVNLLATPVPEPSTFFLLGGGLAGLALVALRRKKV